MISRFDIVVERSQVSEQGDLQRKLVPEHLLGAEVLDENVELGEGDPRTASEGGGYQCSSAVVWARNSWR